jgi:hypothetical protein
LGLPDFSLNFIVFMFGLLINLQYDRKETLPKRKRKKKKGNSFEIGRKEKDRKEKDFFFILH